MGTHWMIFLTIDNLASPPGFPFAGQDEGADWPTSSKRKICPFSAARESRAVKRWSLLSRRSHLGDRMFTQTRGVN